MVAERVVDLLEAVKIHHQHGEAPVSPVEVGKCLLDALVEERAVGEAREVIEVGPLLDLDHLVADAPGDMPQHGDQADAHEQKHHTEDADDRKERGACRVADRLVVLVEGKSRAVLPIAERYLGVGREHLRWCGARVSRR